MNFGPKAAQPVAKVEAKPSSAPIQISDAERIMYPFYSDVCAAIDPILAKLGEQPTATEALNSNIFGRLFVGIADTFIGLLNTFKTNAFKFLKTLKRSEIKEFVESNKLKTSTVYRIPMDKLMDFKVDIPSNMGDTYKSTVDSVNSIYVKLNALNNAKVAYASFNDILKLMSTNSPDASKEVSKIGVMLQTIVKNVKPAVLECQNKFSSTFVVKRSYQDVYADPKEFKLVTDELLDMEFRLSDARAILEYVQKFEATLKAIVNCVANTTISLSQGDVMSLGESAKGLALIFDSYGMAATRQMTLEHNHILNINNIYAKVR